MIRLLSSALMLRSSPGAWVLVQSMDCIMRIRRMNLASLDLNLLVALDALLAEAHVGRAGARIGLSQPAASHALRRLRELLADPLLVRAGARMELTPRAQALRGPLAVALEQVRGLFVAKTFDPRTSTRRFAVMMPDHVVDLVVPPLLARIAGQAPNVRLDVAPWLGPAIMTAELARSIDLVIACTGEAFPGFHRQRLFADTEAIAVRRGHPMGARLSRLDGFLKARHVAVVGRGQREDPIDSWLRERGVERRIALVVPSYLQALHMVSHTDLAAFVPRRLIETLVEPLSLIAVSPPIDPGKYEEFLFQPTRALVDPASIWLKNLVLAVGRGLDRSKRRAA
jgi:DNA-binding transcriptional LysR family regulator